MQIVIFKLLVYAEIYKSPQNILFHNLNWFSVHILVLFWSNFSPNIPFHVGNSQTPNGVLASTEIWWLLIVAVSSSFLGSYFRNIWDDYKAKSKTLPIKFLTHWTSLRGKAWRQKCWFPQSVLSYLLPWIQTVH